jgi:hypothetical protein
MKSHDLYQKRIAEKKYKATDMYHDTGPYALSTEQIQDIPVENVYMWVRTYEWKQRHFKKWLKAMRVI